MILTKICCRCNTEKGLELFNKDNRNLDGRAGCCKTCKNTKRKEHRELNYDIILLQEKEYRNSGGREKNLESCKKYRLTNKEKVKHSRKLSRQSHPDTSARSVAKRRAIKLKALKDWGELNQLIIEEAYKLSRLRSDLTGIEWQVDHVIPLNHPKVCGLHVGINLQVITATENRSKSNNYQTA